MESNFQDFENSLLEFLNFSSTIEYRGPSDMISLPQKRRKIEKNFGYDIRRFESVPVEDFLCGNCKNVVKKPMECKKCSKLYCEDCVQVLKKPKNNDSQFFCCVCASLSNSSVPSTVLVRIINELKIKCPNFEKGCFSFVPLEQLNSHEMTCQYRVISCDNHTTCQQSGLIKDYIQSECNLHSIYSQLSNRSYREYKSYFCSVSCKMTCEFKRLLKENKKHRALEKYLDLLKKLKKNTEINS